MVRDANDHDRYASIKAGKIGPFEICVSESNLVACRKNKWPEDRNLLTLANTIGRHESGRRIRAVFDRFESGGDSRRA